VSAVRIEARLQRERSKVLEVRGEIAEVRVPRHATVLPLTSDL